MGRQEEAGDDIVAEVLDEFAVARGLDPAVVRRGAAVLGAAMERAAQHGLPLVIRLVGQEGLGAGRHRRRPTLWVIEEPDAQEPPE